MLERFGSGLIVQKHLDKSLSDSMTWVRIGTFAQSYVSGTKQFFQQIGIRI